MSAQRRRWLLLSLVLTLGAAVALYVVLRPQLRPDLPAPTSPPGVIACGEERGGGGRNEPADIAARECFWAAYEQHRPAEFRTTQITIEGDPIVYTYRVLAGGTVELAIDSTKDR